MIEVFECDHSNASEWNGFVFSQPRSTYVHRFELNESIKQTYKSRSVYLAAKEHGSIIGIFPLVLPALFKRHTAVSVAYSSYGGMLFAAGIHDEDTIKTAFLEYLRKNYPQCNAVEERKIVWDKTDGAVNEVTLMINLSRFANEKDIFNNFKAEKRNRIRKSLKQGFTKSWDANLLEVFYKVHAIDMGTKGTPVHHADYYRNLRKYFKTDFKLLTVYHNGTCIGGLIGVKHNSIYTVLTSSVLHGYHNICASDFMHWEALRSALENNAALFDFGRSQTGSGTYRFKKQWGTDEFPLSYRNYSLNGKLLEHNSMAIYRGRFGRLFSRFWSMLPLNMQIQWGPYLRRMMC